MPSANDRIAVRANPGRLRNSRAANRISGTMDDMLCLTVQPASAKEVLSEWTTPGASWLGLLHRRLGKAVSSMRVRNEYRIRRSWLQPAWRSTDPGRILKA